MRKADVFNPTRLKFARKRRGIPAHALCEVLGISTKTLSDYENGRSEPQPSLVTKISSELKFPEGFFFADDIAPIDDNTVSFRSLARMSAKVRVAVRHVGQIAMELSEWLDHRFETPGPELPDLKDVAPVAAAEALRNEWALGERPIGNMVHLLESKGVRVFSLAEETKDMDACSFWKGTRPFVFLNTKKSVEHSRFDAAHELAHLVLHKHGEPLGKEVEMQAHRFASAFLMTEGSVKSRFRSCPTLDTMIANKAYWGVSVAAYVRRLKDLALITEWQYRSYSIDLSRRRYMKEEPNPILQREASKLLPMLFQALRDEGVSKYDIAKELEIFSDEIDALVFNLTLIKIEGGSNGDADRNKSNREHLRLVR